MILFGFGSIVLFTCFPYNTTFLPSHYDVVIKKLDTEFFADIISVPVLTYSR